MKIEHGLGLTPVFKRLAWSYLKKGVGSHAIAHHIFDEVIVEELYEWHTPNDESLPAQGGLVVLFMREGKKIRWVEFGCRYIGGGGEPLMREV